MYSEIVICFNLFSFDCDSVWHANDMVSRHDQWRFEPKLSNLGHLAFYIKRDKRNKEINTYAVICSCAMISMPSHPVLRSNHPATSLVFEMSLYIHVCDLGAMFNHTYRVSSWFEFY